MEKNDAISKLIPKDAYVIDELIPKDDYADNYKDKTQSLDSLTNVLRKMKLLESHKIGRFVNYTLTPKGEEIGNKIINTALNPKWEALTSYIFTLWGFKVMRKSIFLDHATQQLIRFYRYNKSLVEKIAEYINCNSIDMTSKVQTISLYSAYACLERFKKEKPQFLEEKYDPNKGNVLLYKQDKICFLQR